MPRLLVVGAGLAGLATAHRASELGWDVELIEAGRRPGGALLQTELLRIPEATWERLRARGAPAEAAFEPAPLMPTQPVAPAWARWLPVRVLDRWAGFFSRTPRAAPPVPAPASPSVLASGPALARSLAASFSVRVGWQVVEVVSGDDAAHLTYLAPSGERSLAADAVVVATPAASLSKLVPARCRELHAALASSSTRDGVAVQFSSSSGAHEDGPEPRLLCLGPGALPVLSWLAWLGEGCLYAELSPRGVDALGDRDDLALASSVAEALTELGEPVDVETARVQRWSDWFLPAEVPAVEGRVVWVERRAGEVGVAGALEAGSRAAERAVKGTPVSPQRDGST